MAIVEIASFIIKKILWSLAHCIMYIAGSIQLEKATIEITTYFCRKRRSEKEILNDWFPSIEKELLKPERPSMMASGKLKGDLGTAKNKKIKKEDIKKKQKKAIAYNAPAMAMAMAMATTAFRCIHASL